MFAIVFLYILCASSFTISKAVLTYGAPFFFTGIRMLIAGLILLGYCAYKQQALRIEKQDRALFIGIIFIYIYLTYMADLWALQDLTSCKASFIYSLSPFIAALFSYLYFGEKMTLKKWFGFALGFIAFIPEMYFPVETETITRGVGFFSLPEFVMLLSATSSVLGWIMVRSLILTGRYTPSFINGVGMFCAGALSLITSFFSETWLHTPPLYDFWPFIGLTLLIIMLTNIIFHNLYSYLLSFYTATFLSFAGFMVPLFVSLLSWLFLSETVGLHYYISVLFVAIGLYVFYQEELKQGYIRS